jgi:hypothetical protein
VVVEAFVNESGVATPQVLAQEQFEWKTYIDPQYGFTLEYPSRHDLSFSADPSGNKTYLMSDPNHGPFWSMHLSIEPFNITKFKDLNGLTDYEYNKSLVDFGNKPLYQINDKEFANYPITTFSTYIDNLEDYPGKMRIFKVALQIHDGNSYLFSLSNLNTDTHFEEFDKMVNSIKFFN